jgi:A118 family predicted phage portal protein
VGENGFTFGVIPRNNMLIFGLDSKGDPTDVGLAEKSAWGQYYYTLLERRQVDEKGYLTIENTLYRAGNNEDLGQAVPLAEHPLYAGLKSRYTYPKPIGSVGLVPLRTPMLNCVDGSAQPVSVFAPAVGLIENINCNEAQLSGEFQRGQSRILVSRDLLDENRALTDHLFVGLDEDAETLGITAFSPQLREASFLARKQEYLRNVESLIGLKRGMLSDANVDERTATEINSSQSDFNLTVLDFRKMWEQMLSRAVPLCRALAELYGLPLWREETFVTDWGNGVLYDRDALWQDYRQMVADGLVKPEIALGWRFRLPAETEAQQKEIRTKFMPAKQIDN